MGVYDFALKMELDGEQYYREQAKMTKYDDLKTVLVGLAEDEHRHYLIVESLQKEKPDAFVEPDPAIINARNVFERAEGKAFIPKDQDSIAKLKAEQIDVYRAALTKEEESVKLYKDLQGSAKQQAEKDILARLVREEERHAAVLDNIIQMFNRANEWVESPEFHHVKPY